MKIIYSFEDYYRLFTLARVRTQSAQDYQFFEQYQCNLLIKYFHNNNIVLQNKLLLDLGCGLGGFVKEFNRNGARSIGLDLEISNSSPSMMMTRSNALVTPFDSNLFDMVSCASLIEHVPNPKALVAEIVRITRPAGYIYISFPPFYSLRGGHQFSPFHLFGERFALWAFRIIKQKSNKNWGDQRLAHDPDSYGQAFGSWGLYRMTLKKCEEILKESPIRIIDCSTKFSFINFTKVPIFREFLTWHVQYLITKL
jgi:SAM-dependent methyltransferase